MPPKSRRVPHVLRARVGCDAADSILRRQPGSFASTGQLPVYPAVQRALSLKSLLLAIQHHLVKGMGQRLAVRVGTRFISAGFDSGLREF
jgi:hypothetical protein